MRAVTDDNPGCPPELVLERFAAGELGDHEQTGIQTHLSSCDTCAAWMRDCEADEELVTSVRRVLESERAPVVALAPGATVGGYRLVREIGRGGMGSVWEAEQSSPRRSVALKVIRADAASSRMLRRLEREAFVLGRLQHPGIAQVFEAGTFESAQGPQPFFAMELITGDRLNDWVGSRELDVRRRLELLVGICDAVHHAHQKGVIHRDLKPANILVDGTGQPKVLDFGVARADLEAADDPSLETRVGQLIGTLPYMSPEQVAGDPDDIDVRTDVYALGVIAYEVLGGRLPLDLREATVTRAIRAITEDEPTPLGEVDSRLRGDLETIVGKALEKDKERRYGSAADLGRDIERHLNNEPIAARPLTTIYQLRKFARRNSALVGGVLGVFVVLVAGIVTTSLQADRARAAETTARTAEGRAVKSAGEAKAAAADADAQRREAEVQLKQARAARDFFQEVISLAKSHERDGAPPTVDKAFEIALQRVDERAMEEPVVEAAIRHVLGEVLMSMRKFDEAEGHLTRALHLYEEAYGEEHHQVLYVLSHLATLHANRLEVAKAEELARRALGMQHVLDDQNSVLLVGALSALAKAHFGQLRFEDAIAAQRKSLAVCERIPDESQRGANAGVTTAHLAVFHKHKGDKAEAERLSVEAIGLLREHLPGNPHLAEALIQHADLLGRRDLEQSEQLIREALSIQQTVSGAEHEATVKPLQKLAFVLFANGERTEAIELGRRAVDIVRARLGEGVDLVRQLDKLGELLVSAGQLTDAEQARREALRIGERDPGAEHWLTNSVRNGLGHVLWAQKRFAEALVLLDRSVDLYENKLASQRGSDMARVLRGACLASLERYDEAEPQLLAVLDLMDKKRLGPSNRDYRLALSVLAWLYGRTDRPEEASKYRARMRSRER